MFQDMTKQFNESMAPFRELVNIQTKMLEELTRQQMECTKACLDATMQQSSELQKCKSPNDLIELQQAYAKELEATLKAANEQNLKALTEAQKAMQQLAQGSLEAFSAKK
ncbi:MAG: phasin family protein [Oceanospirillales bacterium]|uniref:Phasin protein n=1 Tax=Marinobacterium halophilum TaxID=267374 RepID=A0A2P8ESY2_9GAMM|nr:phasin family protein [Marinobacterium halophilum]MBR9829761.1 phasin family protein [Oceanospirillales bacterium]PSL12564.1 phasin protein [Marinobacterium halophilum]